MHAQAQVEPYPRHIHAVRVPCRYGAPNPPPPPPVACLARASRLGHHRRVGVGGGELLHGARAQALEVPDVDGRRLPNALVHVDGRARADGQPAGVRGAAVAVEHHLPRLRVPEEKPPNVDGVLERHDGDAEDLPVALADELPALDELHHEIEGQGPRGPAVLQQEGERDERVARHSQDQAAVVLRLARICTDAGREGLAIAGAAADDGAAAGAPAHAPRGDATRVSTKLPSARPMSPAVWTRCSFTRT